MSWTEYAPSVAKIIQKSEILSKSQKNDWKLAVYGVLTIYTSANENLPKAKLNHRYVTIPLLYLRNGNGMEKDGRAR